MDAHTACLLFVLSTSVLSTLNITCLLHTWQPCVIHTGSFLSDVSAKVCKKRSLASLTLSYTARTHWCMKRLLLTLWVTEQRGSSSSVLSTPAVLKTSNVSATSLSTHQHYSLQPPSMPSTASVRRPLLPHLKGGPCF